MEKSSNKFLKGAAILGIAGIIVKVMGVFFRIPVTLWIGADGMSYYNSVYPIYTFFLILSTAGIPVAISRMVSERIAKNNYQGAHKVFNISVYLLAAIGLASFLLVYIGAGFIEKSILHNEGTIYSIQAIAPSLLLVPIMAAYRGYFQGRQIMGPTAISQLFEQLFRVGIGLILCRVLMSTGNQFAASGAIFGCTAGAAIGLIVIILIYFLHRKNIKKQIEKNKEYYVKEHTRDIIKKILVIAIPITIGACILPLVNAIDSMMVMPRLQATGWTVEESRHLWGLLGGYVSSLVGMPQVFVQAIVMSLVPAIAASYALRDQIQVQENTKFALRAAMLIGTPCAAGMFALSWPVMKLLYFAPQRAGEVDEAAPLLALMSISIIFLSIMQTLTGALQGIDKQMIPVKNLLIGAVAKVIVTFILVGIPFINVKGAPIGTIVCYIVASVLNIKDVQKYSGVKFDPVLTYLRPFAASAGMGIIAYAFYKLLFLITGVNSFSCVIAVGIGVLSYVVLIFMLKAITIDELKKLPKGDKLAKIASKFVK